MSYASGAPPYGSGFAGGYGYATYGRQTAKALVFRERGIFYKLFVALGTELAFDLRWELSQIMLQIRIVPVESYDAWVADNSRRVDVWAYMYGKGVIRGRFLPPFAGQWVLLVDSVQITWPPMKTDPIELTSMIYTSPPVD